MPEPLRIEVVSDPVCPWCYVGKRRLEKAVVQRPDLNIEVSWQPFQLTPDMPREGRDRFAHYAEIFGEERAKQIMGSMKDTGLEEGIAFDSRPGARSPNTLSAHVLMLWAQQDVSVDANELVEKLFHAHHVACEDIGDHQVLARIASEVGMDATDVAAKLAAGDDEERVRELITQAAARGVTGVPFFIVNGRFGVSGAQPADELVAVFDQIAANTA